MQPANYMLNVASPLESGLKGFESGMLLQQKEIANQAAQQKLAMQQQDMLQKQQMQMELATLASNPMAKASDYARVMTRYPQLSEHLKRANDTLSGEQQRNRLSGASQVFAAINAGNNPVAIDLLTQQAQAYRNGGNEQAAKEAETIAKLIELHPETAKASIGVTLASLMGPEKFAETFKTLGEESRAVAEAPVKLKKLTAEASKAEKDADIAAVTARFAESKAIKDLALSDAQIKRWQEETEIARKNVQIAAANVAIAREGNQLKREELTLRRDDLVRKRDDDLRVKAAEVESARMNMDNFLNTADRILATPKGVVGSAAGPLSAKIPTTFQSTADFEALIENLGAQAFMSQIPQMKGTGALSDAEGKKLAAALQNFSLTQSPDQLLKNVREAQRLVLLGRKNLSLKYGVPDTVPDTPAAAQATSPSEVDALVKQYTTPAGAVTGRARTR